MSFAELAHRLAASYDKDVGSGAPATDIESAEMRLGVRIDGGFRDFLLLFGWGGVSHIELYGLGPDVPTHLDLIAITESERQEMHPPLPMALVPITNDGSGNLLCITLQVQSGNESPVFLWQHDHPDGSKQLLRQEASTFAEWLSDELDRL